MRSSEKTIRKLLTDSLRLYERSRTKEAEKKLRKVLRIAPNQPDALHLLGVLKGTSGHTNEAKRLINKAITADPSFADAHYNLGRVHQDDGDFENAERSYNQVLILAPNNARALNNLGTLFEARKLFSEAKDYFQKAEIADPSYVDPLVNQCNILRKRGEYKDLLAVCDTASARFPEFPDFRIFQSEAHFMLGNFADGWRSYDWRFRARRDAISVSPYTFPVWDGTSLKGKCILVWSEQGPGDEVLLASMLAEVVAEAAVCHIQCSQRLTTLFKRSFPSAIVHGQELPRKLNDQVDFQCSFSDLGSWVRSDQTHFPKHSGYLKVDEGQVAQLRKKYSVTSPENLIVGIAWRSSGVTFAADKTIPLELWAPILAMPGITFVNLQYGDHKPEIRAIASPLRKHIISDGDIDPTGDLDAHAAQVAACDLIISNSNTVVHLAGALARSVWCMVPCTLGYGLRWYWFGNTYHSPWYPTLKIFRQAQHSEWLDVILEVGYELAIFLSTHGHKNLGARALAAQIAIQTKADKKDKALQLFGYAEKVDWQSPDSNYLMAESLSQLNRWSDALAYANRAVELEPLSAKNNNSRGSILTHLNREDEAIESFSRAIQSDPNLYEAHNNLGSTYRKQGDINSAERSYRKASELNNTHPVIAANLGSILYQNGKIEQALAQLDYALSLDPDSILAHYNKSLALLSSARFSGGWREFKWRLDKADANVRHDHFPHPIWEGDNTNAKKLLIWTEQGIGDELLLGTMINDAIAASSKVIVLCSQRLINLFRRSFPDATVELRDEPIPPAALAPDIDYQMSFSELGLCFRNKASDFSGSKPYLSPDPSQVLELRTKYNDIKPGSKLVGISWNSSNNEIGSHKSLEIDALGPLLDCPNTTFVSVQYGMTHMDMNEINRRLKANIFFDESVDPLTNMEAAATQLAALDLVISISNTTVHTAGALGVPVWMLLANGLGRHWYWTRTSNSCLWYPSVKFFEQDKAQDWRPVIQACAQDLKDFALP